MRSMMEVLEREREGRRLRRGILSRVFFFFFFSLRLLRSGAAGDTKQILLFITLHVYK